MASLNKYIWYLEFGSRELIFTAENGEKKASQFIENPTKIDVWGSSGAFLEPLGKHLGHMLPKDWILEAFGNVLGAQDVQFGSNLEVQAPPKSMQEREKVDVKT